MSFLRSEKQIQPGTLIGLYLHTLSTVIGVCEATLKKACEGTAFFEVWGGWATSMSGVLGVLGRRRLHIIHPCAISHRDAYCPAGSVVPPYRIPSYHLWSASQLTLVLALWRRSRPLLWYAIVCPWPPFYGTLVRTRPGRTQSYEDQRNINCRGDRNIQSGLRGLGDETYMICYLRGP